ncbi:MAG: nucleoside hydrolase-like domain-containing protein [Cyclobacteriaceae bacterium]
MLYTLKLHSLVVWILFSALFQISALTQQKKKPKVIVTTDGEFDDRCSMIRFLLYANEFDIQGIVHSSSKFHWKGNDTTESYQWHDVSWIDQHIQAYSEVYPNLIQHDPEFPEPSYLQELVYEGNTELAGDMVKETPGSDRIVEVLLSPDPTPVWLQAWGGSNTIARALKTIEEKHPDRKQDVMEKARLFLILLQDSTYQNYIAPHWPELTTLLSTSFESIGYPWKKRVPDSFRQYYLGEWMNEHLLYDHGPLLAIYQDHLYGDDRTNGDFISEGDYPAIMNRIPIGLRVDCNPTWGGWGGRFYLDDSLWRSAPDDQDIFKSIYRWIPDYQRDFAARADWCVETYEQANHPPTVKLNVDTDLTVSPGENVQLSAKDSTDPDGDPLQYHWWQYNDADTYSQTITLTDANQSTTEFQIPKYAQDNLTIHIICDVTDQGEPTLTRYERIVLRVDTNK